MRFRRTLLMAAVALLGCVLLIAAVGGGARGQSAAPAGADAGWAAVCDGVMAFPADECRALAALYVATGGPLWSTRTGWGAVDAPGAPCNWYGVECRGTQVTGLRLQQNNLDGTLPAALADLDALAVLRLENNLVGARAPAVLCALLDTVTEADFSYNRLRAGSPRVRECLDTLDPGWEATQTVPPRNVMPTAITTDTVALAWQPISYTTATGRYEVAVSTLISGPWDVRAELPLTAASVTISGLTPGMTHWLRVRTQTEAGGPQANDLAVATVPMPFVMDSEERVLVAVYFAGDNDLAPNIPDVLERLRRGTLLNRTAEVAFLADGAGDGDSVLYAIAGGTVTTTTAVLDHFGTPEIDGGDPAALAWFLQEARARTPDAAREIVALIGHGLGLVPGLDFAQGGQAAGVRSEAPPLPREIDTTATDLTSGSYLSTADYGEAFAIATNDGAEPFDIVFFDQCFGGSLDALYEVRGAAEVFVASPNYAWLAAPYDRYLPIFAPTRPPAEMASLLLRVYESVLDPGHPNAIVAVERGQIEALHAAASELAAALIDATAAGAIEPIAAAVMGSRFADSAQCGRQGFRLGPPDEMIGARRFADGLRAGFASGPVHDAAQALFDLASAVEVRGRIGVPYVAPDERWEYDDVLTLIAPLPRATAPGVAWRASVFRGDAPFAAVYGPAPHLAVQVVDGFASARDGLWDEFLAEWYTSDPFTPTVGAWCRYTPPWLVFADDAVLVPLTVTIAGPNEATLAWDGVEGAVAYRLYLERPRRGGWGLAATLPAPITRYAVSGATPGLYATRLAAMDGEETVIAYSNPVTFTIDTRTWLPLITR